VQGGHRRLARVHLGDVVDIEHRAVTAVCQEQAVVIEATPGHRVDVDGHRFGTTMRCPAASPEPLACTRPSASSKSPKLTGTRWWMPSASTTSTA